jgi:hypothetical protein
MHIHFQQAIEDHHILIVSGYGWGDKSISSRVLNWLESGKENFIIMLYDDPEKEVKIDNYNPLTLRYDDLVKENKIIPHPKYLQNVTLGKLFELIQSHEVRSTPTGQ